MVTSCSDGAGETCGAIGDIGGVPSDVRGSTSKLATMLSNAAWSTAFSAIGFDMAASNMTTASVPGVKCSTPAAVESDGNDPATSGVCTAATGPPIATE